VWTNFVQEAKNFDHSRLCLAGAWQEGKGGEYQPTEECASALIERHAPVPKVNQPTWIMIIGDSNFRRVFHDVCTAFQAVQNYGGNQFSDRECSFGNLFISLRFVPMWSHSSGIQAAKVDSALLTPEKAVEHVALADGGYTWNMENPFTLKPKGAKPFVIWNFGLWELMGKGDDDVYFRNLAATLKQRIQQVKESGKWLENWTFITTPFVKPADDRRKGLLTEDRIFTLNAIASKAVRDSGHNIIDWFKLSKGHPEYMSDGYHLDGKLYEVALKSILRLVHSHIDWVNMNGSQ